jgi:hypothetical protein
VARQDRWSSAERAAVAHYEGLPLSVQGFLIRSKEEGTESPNCRGQASQLRDFHIWLVLSGAGQDRRRSIVVEVTPRIRTNHPKWTLETIQSVIDYHLSVQISGWLMLDPEHPDQVGKARASLWEIDPVMQIEVHNSNGQWITLDDLHR